MKNRIYKYDNVKAILIFLVVVGHMTSDYVSDSHLVRWTTLWIYMFHMPAFIFISGLVHKQYIDEERANAGVRGETRLRLDKVLGFFLCGYALKVFLQVSRTCMGQDPTWSWYEEPGIPWYLFVMAEFELVFFLMRYIDGRIKPRYVIAGAFLISAIIGYFPSVNEAFCLSRMINFLPIYALGYYSDMRVFLEWIEKKRYVVWGWIIIAVSLIGCYMAPWKAYGLRKWFTGRRSYEYLSHFFGDAAIQFGWGIRLLVWAFAILLSLAIIAVIPDRDMGFITTIGARTLNVYFWHRPLCYLFRNWAVLPRLCVLFGGTYDATAAGTRAGLAFGGSPWSMLAAFLVYILIAAAMTAFFSLKIFEHPCSDLMKLSARITSGKEKTR
ncbi:MAG: acyltransferase family protein [Mogibacterium sp.]|nr:acyltransferase family protein [Mogibacterium sp.]